MSRQARAPAARRLDTVGRLTTHQALGTTVHSACQIDGYVGGQMSPSSCKSKLRPLQLPVSTAHDHPAGRPDITTLDAAVIINLRISSRRRFGTFADVYG